MGEKRFINASERSVWLLQGVAYYGKYMHTGYAEDEIKWLNWVEERGPEMRAAAIQVQDQAFIASQQKEFDGWLC